ncbi:MAG: HAMP domain-containing sensor histidine kinase [Ruminococcus sp.]|nr:HAMP domain-containing sensor histidine kinase [Ruminococcus sp.]
MKRFRKAKREKAWWVFTKSAAVALVLACVFAIGFQTFLYKTVTSQCRNEMAYNTTSHLEKISDIVSKKETDEDIFRETDTRLSMYTHYEIYLEQFGLLDPQSMHAIQIGPTYGKGCHAVSALVDSDGNIVASNERKLITLLLFDKDKENDPDRGFYICDEEKLGMGVVDNLYEDYAELSGDNAKNIYVSLEADSMYINKKDHTFVPHEGRFIIETYKPKGFFKGEENGPTYITDKTEIKTETKEFEIDIDSPDFELTEVHQGISSESNPRYALFNFWGADKEVFGSFENEFTHPDESWSSYSYRGNNDGTAVFGDNVSLTINKERYTLMTRYIVNYMEPSLVRYYWTYTILVAALLLIIALLYAWRRCVRNKAEYAMEDYQRDLTNTLAHDIKTPLTAIGGYAENILDGGLSEDEEQKYLRSILDNVAFTDSMVSRTLRLNTMSEQRLTREKVNAAELVESAMKKYEVLLEEKNITFTLKGSAEVKANRASLVTIIENLVSNAVKYTSENGTIRADLDRKRLVLTNTVASKVDVKELKQPFVRGDASRSNVQGSGLGLSLAERAAQLSGMAVKLSCSDSEFRSELRF